MTWSKVRWIGVALSVGWFLATLTVLTHQRSLDVGRQIRECHQIRDAARTSPLCTQAGAASDTRLCSFKDADCDYWPLDEALYRKRIALFAVLPIVLGWLAAYGVGRRRWRAARQSPNS